MKSSLIAVLALATSFAFADVGSVTEGSRIKLNSSLNYPPQFLSLHVASFDCKFNEYPGFFREPTIQEGKLDIYLAKSNMKNEKGFQIKSGTELTVGPSLSARHYLLNNPRTLLVNEADPSKNLEIVPVNTKGNCQFTDAHFRKVLKKINATLEIR